MQWHPKIDVAFAFVYFLFCASIAGLGYGERIVGPHFLAILCDSCKTCEFRRSGEPRIVVRRRGVEKLELTGFRLPPE